VGNPDSEDVVEAILEKIPFGPGGKIMLVGISRTERISFVIDKLRRKEINVINVRGQNKSMQPAIDMVASGRVNVEFMMTHRFKLKQTPQAFDMVAGYRDGVVKALVEF
jgi:L-iditol 2-dehydrogenase